MQLKQPYMPAARGFTLIEMAISIIILGLLMSMGMQLYSSYIKSERISHTTEVVTKVNTAIQAFKNAYGRYPCPAPIREPRESENHGREIDCSGSAGGAPPPVPPAKMINDPMNCGTSGSYRGGATYCLVSPAYWASLLPTGITTANNVFTWMYGNSTTAPEECTKFGTDYACQINTVNARIDAYIASLPPPGTGPGADPARTLTAGQCLIGTGGTPNGLCIEASTRADLPYIPRVRVGGIPFRSLQIDEKDTTDGYGNRLVYVVTEKLANTSSFKAREGGIKILDSNGVPLSDGAGSAAYLLISPGPNHNGAVSTDGINLACTATNLDGENCREYAANTTTTNAIYAMDATAIGFDDSVAYYIPNENTLWRRTNATSEDVVDMSEGRVGIGIDDPTQITDTLTVGQSSVNYTANPIEFGKLAVTNGSINFQSGSLRVGDGTTSNNKLFATKYCDVDGMNCFTPENIAKPYDGHGSTTAGNGMGGCPSDQYMLGIQEGRPICGPIRFACTAPNAVFVGFNSSGTPKCEVPIASCATDTAEICGDSRPLPASGHGTSIDLVYNTNGSCASKSYICETGSWRVKNETDGAQYASWHYNTTSCSYNISSPTTGSTPNVSCGTGYTGTYTQNWTLACNGTKMNTSTSDNTCSCEGDTMTEDFTCSSNFGSNVVAHRTNTKGCSGNTLDPNWTLGGWKDLAGNSVSNPQSLCTCSKTDSWEFAACDSGMVRKASPQPAIFSNPSASWPADDTLGKYRNVTVDMNNCVLNQPNYNSTNCICDPNASQFIQKDPVCGVCEDVGTKSNVRQIRTGAGCSWADDPNTSANTNGTCKPRIFKWKSNNVVAGTATLTEGRGNAVTPESGCACGAAGSEKSCASSTASGWIFYTCTCSYAP